MKFLVTKVNYRTPDGRLVVDVYGRSEDGKRVHKILKGTRPYFYALDKPPKKSAMITNVTREGRDIFGRDLYKIYTRFPSDVAKVRELFDRHRHFEANVLYDNRVKIDHNCFGVIETPEQKVITTTQIKRIEGMDIKPRYSIQDIELDTDKADPDNPKHEVIADTIYDSYANAYLSIVVGRVDKARVLEILDEELLKMVDGDQKKFEKYRFREKLNILSVMTEEELFEKIGKYFNKYQPDLVSGWNFEHFDWKYMIERIKKERYAMPDFRSREVFDMMKGYSRLHEGENRESLEWCANNDFGFGKLKFEGSFPDLYRTDRDRFVAYNIWDVYLCELLNRKRNILGFHLMLSNLSSCPLHKAIYNSRIIDSFVLQFLKGKYVLPTYPATVEGKVDKGGYVHEPARGVFDHIFVLDLKSEYPSIIISSNLSPETLWRGRDPPPDPENYYKTPRGNYYDKRKKGILPIIIEFLMTKRDNLKIERGTFEVGTPDYLMLNDMQRAVKELMNSFYGVMAYRDFRLRDTEVGSDITAYARENVEWIIDVANELGYTDIYADTDSVFVQSKHTDLEEYGSYESLLEAQMEEGFELVQAINNTFGEFGARYGMDDLKLLLQFEKIYEVWFQAAEEVKIKGKKKMKGAKRYVGLISWKDGKKILHEPLDIRKEVKGFEVKRINVAPYAKKIQHKVFDLILTKIPVDEVGKFIRGVHKAVVTGQVPPELLAIPAKVNQERYDPMPAFIRSVYYTKETMGIDMTSVGSNFIWCYGHLRDKPIVYAKGKKDCAVAIPQGEKFPETFEINIDKMIQRTIKGPLDSIVSGIGLGDIDELLSPMKTPSLESFA